MILISFSLTLSTSSLSLDTLFSLDMIEIIRDRIPQLIRLSRPFAAQLLIRHVDQLTPATIVKQLLSEADTELLHW